jgi:ArsR family transcriptional regulator
MDGYSTVANIMKALGHPVRLQILEVLRQEEACVCHLEAVLGQRQAYISQHLMKLRDAGLVIDRREGLNVFYSLSGEGVGMLMDTARNTAGILSPEPLSYALPAVPGSARCSCPKCAPETVAEP